MPIYLLEIVCVGSLADALLQVNSDEIDWYKIKWI